MKTKKLKNLAITLSKIGFNDYSILVGELLKSAADQVATNRAISQEIPDNYFTPEDVDLERYKEKLIVLFKRDIGASSFEKFKKRFMKEGKSEMEAIDAALKLIEDESRKAAEKSIRTHSIATSMLEESGSMPGELVISPGSGFAHEQVVSPKYRWRGLEYQTNLTNMANQRNMQMGIIDSKSREWSLLRGPVDDSIGNSWEENLNSIIDEEGVPDTIYAKHACGGLTDGVMFDAANKGIKKMLFATCCAHRYPEVSWRILNPKDESGMPMDFESYRDIAYSSKKQGKEGMVFVDKIDGWREDFLKSRGYAVERGIKNFGPYILAKKS